MEQEQKEPQKEEKKPGMNYAVMGIVVAIVVIAGIVIFAQSRKADKSVQPGAMQTVKTYEISAKPFEFSIKEIRVKKGDKVRINLAVTQGMHDWVVDEFNARTKQIQAGATDSVEFTADKTGTYEYYCSVGTHRQMGMVGKLIVE